MDQSQDTYSLTTIACWRRWWKVMNFLLTLDSQLMSFTGATSIWLGIHSANNTATHIVTLSSRTMMDIHSILTHPLQSKQMYGLVGIMPFVGRWGWTSSTSSWMKWSSRGMKMFRQSWAKRAGIHAMYSFSYMYNLSWMSAFDSQMNMNKMIVYCNKTVTTKQEHCYSKIWGSYKMRGMLLQN